MTKTQRKIITTLYFKHLSNHCELKYSKALTTSALLDEYNVYTITDKKYICSITLDKEGLHIDNPMLQLEETYDLHDQDFDTKAANLILNLIEYD